MAQLSGRFSSPLDGGPIARVLCCIQQRLDLGLGVIESHDGLLLLQADIHFLDAFHLVKCLFDGDRAGRACHAEWSKYSNGLKIKKLR